MTQTYESGQDIILFGKSGTYYQGKMYTDKNSSSTLPPPAIVCLSNSRWIDNHWQHEVRDIYDTASVIDALNHFRERDDISHMILIPKDPGGDAGMDRIDDLRRNYIHG
jgi:hypothetical protein